MLTLRLLISTPVPLSYILKLMSVSTETPDSEGAGLQLAVKGGDKSLIVVKA